MLNIFYLFQLQIVEASQPHSSLHPPRDKDQKISYSSQDSKRSSQGLSMVATLSQHTADTGGGRDSVEPPIIGTIYSLESQYSQDRRHNLDSRESLVKDSMQGWECTHDDQVPQTDSLPPLDLTISPDSSQGMGDSQDLCAQTIEIVS